MSCKRETPQINFQGSLWCADYCAPVIQCMTFDDSLKITKSIAPNGCDSNRISIPGNTRYYPDRKERRNVEDVYDGYPKSHEFSYQLIPVDDQSFVICYFKNLPGSAGAVDVTRLYTKCGSKYIPESNIIPDTVRLSSMLADTFFAILHPRGLSGSSNEKGMKLVEKTPNCFESTQPFDPIKQVLMKRVFYDQNNQVIPILDNFDLFRERKAENMTKYKRQYVIPVGMNPMGHERMLEFFNVQTDGEMEWFYIGTIDECIEKQILRFN